MDTTPLVIDDIEAGKDFIARLDRYRPVEGACWLGKEDGQRYLYVVLRDLTLDDRDLAYGEVLRITKEMTDWYLDPFRVKVVGPDDAVAKALADVYSRYPGPVPATLSAGSFGGISVADLYIYQPLRRNP